MPFNFVIDVTQTVANKSHRDDRQLTLGFNPMHGNNKSIYLN